MKVLHFGLALFLVAVSASSTSFAINEKTEALVADGLPKKKHRRDNVQAEEHNNMEIEHPLEDKTQKPLNPHRIKNSHRRIQRDLRAHPVKETPQKEDIHTLSQHAMDVENTNEAQEKQKFEHMLHMFASYVQRLSGEHFAEQDLKALHTAFHALTPAQKENFLKQFSEEQVQAHIIEKLKLLYEQFPKPHHG